jgi:hypothetical protein
MDIRTKGGTGVTIRLIPKIMGLPVVMPDLLSVHLKGIGLSGCSLVGEAQEKQKQVPSGFLIKYGIKAPAVLLLSLAHRLTPVM